MRTASKRRSDLLRLEEKGFTRSEITKALAKQYDVTARTIQYDFEHRTQWQPRVQGYDDQKCLLLSTVNTLKGLLSEAQLKAYRDDGIPDTVKVAWAKIVGETAVKIYSLLYPTRLQHDLFIKTEDTRQQIDFNSLPKKEQKIIQKAVEIIAEAKLGANIENV